MDKNIDEPWFSPFDQLGNKDIGLKRESGSKVIKLPIDITMI